MASPAHISALDVQKEPHSTVDLVVLLGPPISEDSILSACRYLLWSVQSIRVELRGVWLRGWRGQCPIVQSPQPTNPPTLLKSPPRKSWVAISQSTKYQCSATNKQTNKITPTNQKTPLKSMPSEGIWASGIFG